MAPGEGALTRGPSVETKTKFSDVTEEVPPPPPPPPEHVYPCGCAYPGSHAPDCMWSLWEQMRDNYNQTKTLMAKFMTQVDGIQSPAGMRSCQCKCPSGCHGRDLGEAVGLQQLTGVTVPFGMPRSPTAGEASGLATAPGYPVTNEARKQMEEQHRIKSTWAQFLNIFDMSLDLANGVSKDRQEAKRRRKECARLEREQQKEEARRERQERCSEAKQRAGDTAAQKKQEKEDGKGKGNENPKEKKSEEKPKEKKQPKPEPKPEPEPEPKGEDDTPQPEDRTPTENQETPEPTADEEEAAQTTNE